MLTLPSLRVDPHVVVSGCAAPREASRVAFSAEFGGNTHATVDDLSNDPEIEAVYIATPHHMHREHAMVLARGGKHLLIDKPLAISMSDADAIVEAARAAGVHLITGPSHSFDQPVVLAREIIASGRFGEPRMIHGLNYTDFLYRPRRPEELVTARGGGVIFSQAVHQVDVIRLLMGRRATHVAAITGAWDASRSTECSYSALIGFEGGRFASITYSGYAHYDSDVLQEGVGELGVEKDLSSYGNARKALAQVISAKEEASLKYSRTFGTAETPPLAPHAEHFGPVIISCDRADLRLTAKGVEIWGDFEKEFLPAPPDPAPRSPVLKALHEAIRADRPPAQSDDWGRASLEVCHAILESADTGSFVDLKRQDHNQAEEDQIA